MQKRAVCDAGSGTVDVIPYSSLLCDRYRCPDMVQVRSGAVSHVVTSAVTGVGSCDWPTAVAQINPGDQRHTPISHIGAKL